MRKVCVVGLGNVGIPLSIVMAQKGISVYGYDINKKKIDLLNKGINPIKDEKGVDIFLKSFLNKKLFFFDNLKTLREKVNAYIIVVPLLLDNYKKADFKYLDSAFEEVAKNLKKKDLVVLETTVPPGTTENRFKKILEKFSGLKAGIDFFLGYSPERIMTGKSISRYSEFPKVISGINEESLKEVKKLYSVFCNKVIESNSMKEAELIKVAEGIYRDVNIAIANELYKICDMYSVSFFKVRKKANHKYCNILLPGIGVGGHCIPVYPWFVINEGIKNRINFNLILNARSVNDSMIDYFINKILKINVKQRIKTIGIIGLAYREGISHISYSMNYEFALKLKELGFNIIYFDDYIDTADFKKGSVKDIYTCDLIVVANYLKKYKDCLQKYKGIIIDLKNLMGD